jgi:hypothetical protein
VTIPLEPTCHRQAALSSGGQKRPKAGTRATRNPDLSG